MPSGSFDPAWMITPRSHLLGRITPRVEQVRMPGGIVAGGTLHYARGEILAEPKAQEKVPWRRVMFHGRSQRRLEQPGIIIDLRRHSPKNWAHMLTNHLPYVFTLADTCSLDWSELVLVLPADSPSHITSAVELFGLRTIRTDASLFGEGIKFEALPWVGNRGARADWVRAPRVRSALEKAFLSVEPAQSLPRKVFVSRRDRRRLSNEAEVIAHLAKSGIVALYAEDLAPLEQFRLLAYAELVIAIHGAALAPLLYRPPAAPPATVIELFPVGHVTGVWRTVAGQVRCHWAAVRGRIEPKHITGGLYDLEQPFMNYSNDDFEIDPLSIDRALELVDKEPRNTEMGT